jgi:hypothetical protein
MSGDLTTLTRGKLRGEKVRLEQRLAVGWQHCDRARDEGAWDTLCRLEDFWLGLLGEYERVCEALASRA